MHRATLKKIMQSLRTAGGMLPRHIVRSDVLMRNVSAAKLNACLVQEYPRGLKFLVTQETVKGARQPLRRFVLTRIGREFLQRLEVDSSAVPVVPPYAQAHSVETPLARQFQIQQADKRRRKERRQKKLQWRGRPRDKSEYEQPLNVDPRSKEFRRLTPLERIRALRTQSGRIQEKP